jgi:putative peptidoglycan lipid II flippase
VARVLAAGVPGPESVAALTDATAAFAPGLVGYGLVALLGRALYARGDGRTPAVATVTGWLVVTVADIALVAVGPFDRVTALGLGNTIGMSVAGVLLVAGIRRAAPDALRRTAHTTGVCIVACLLALTVGKLLPVPDTSVTASVGWAVLLAAVAAGVYLGVVRLLDADALRILRRV